MWERLGDIVMGEIRTAPLRRNALPYGMVEKLPYPTTFDLNTDMEWRAIHEMRVWIYIGDIPDPQLREFLINTIQSTGYTRTQARNIRVTYSYECQSCHTSGGSKSSWDYRGSGPRRPWKCRLCGEGWHANSDYEITVSIRGECRCSGNSGRSGLLSSLPSVTHMG